MRSLYEMVMRDSDIDFCEALKEKDKEPFAEKKNEIVRKLFEVMSTRLPERFHLNESRAHYVMVSKIQWKPFWLATQLYPQNDWTGWQNGVNDDVCRQALLQTSQKTHWGRVNQRKKMLCKVIGL